MSQSRIYIQQKSFPKFPLKTIIIIPSISIYIYTHARKIRFEELAPSSSFQEVPIYTHKYTSLSPHTHPRVAASRIQLVATRLSLSLPPRISIKMSHFIFKLDFAFHLSAAGRLSTSARHDGISPRVPPLLYLRDTIVVSKASIFDRSRSGKPRDAPVAGMTRRRCFHFAVKNESAKSDKSHSVDRRIRKSHILFCRGDKFCRELRERRGVGCRGSERLSNLR